jgi:hypothetical protein
MSGRYGPGLSRRARRRTLFQRACRIVWQVLRAVLLAGAAMGPSMPPPPPPPPQTIEAKAESDASEEED